MQIGEEEQGKEWARRNGKGGMRGKSTEGERKNSGTQRGQKILSLTWNHCSGAPNLFFSHEDKNTAFVLFYLIAVGCGHRPAGLCAISRRSLGKPRGPMFVFITPLPLASGAGMRSGFKVRRCAFICAHQRVQTLSHLAALCVGGLSFIRACLKDCRLIGYCL